MASVNAVPGGSPVRERAINHRPDASSPQIVVVGDYLFDSTLNGVLDSADSATDLILADVLSRRRAAQKELEGTLGADMWYPGAGEQVRDQFFGGPYLAELLKLVWGVGPGARVLNLGSASGITVAALRQLGFDAYGVESGRLAHGAPPKTCASSICSPIRPTCRLPTAISMSSLKRACVTCRARKSRTQSARYGGLPGAA